MAPGRAAVGQFSAHSSYYERICFETRELRQPVHASPADPEILDHLSHFSAL